MPAPRIAVHDPPQDRSLLQAVRTLSVSLRGWLGEVLPERGLTTAQFWTLNDIAEHEPVNAAHLATYRCVTPPTVSVAIEDLVRAGWVDRQRSQDDRRVVVLSLSSRGRKLLGDVWRDLEDRILEATRGVAQRDLEAVARVVQAISGRDRAVLVPLPKGAA